MISFAMRVPAHQRPQTGRTVVGETSVYQTLKEEDEMLAKHFPFLCGPRDNEQADSTQSAPGRRALAKTQGFVFLNSDYNKSGTLSFEELSEMLQSIDKKVTSLPATAQRAAQQGVYLGRKLTRLAHAVPHW